MTIRQAFGAALLGDTGVREVVDDRVYYMVCPPKTPFPRITFQVTRQSYTRHMTAQAAFCETTLAVDCWGLNMADTENAAEAVRLGFNQMLNTTIGTGPHTVFVQNAYLEDVRDMHGAPGDGSASGVFHISQTWRVWHTCTVPTLTV
jgi:hypothetical protein